ncbi:MAG TPA: hypothetical protein VE987_22030, partial [Polyangiaceae bacterium]|nr:hypothetical protein [Polyangiaceae bacterium]
AGALRRIEPLLDDASPDGWTIAAAAVQALRLRDDARLFAGRARALAATKGFVSSHRRQRLLDVVRSLVPDVRGAGVSHG